MLSIPTSLKSDWMTSRLPHADLAGSERLTGGDQVRGEPPGCRCFSGMEGHSRFQRILRTCCNPKLPGSCWWRVTETEHLHANTDRIPQDSPLTGEATAQMLCPELDLGLNSPRCATAPSDPWEMSSTAAKRELGLD